MPGKELYSLLCRDSYKDLLVGVAGGSNILANLTGDLSSALGL
jgi:hypothetical protein